MEKLVSSYEEYEEKQKLTLEKNSLQNTRRSDDELLFASKKSLGDEYKVGKDNLELSTIKQNEIEMEEEEHLNKISCALEEKLEKGEIKFLLEQESFECKKREQHTTTNLTISNNEDTNEECFIGEGKVVHTEKSHMKGKMLEKRPQIEGVSLEPESNMNPEETKERKGIEVETEPESDEDGSNNMNDGINGNTTNAKGEDETEAECEAESEDDDEADENNKKIKTKNVVKLLNTTNSISKNVKG